MVKISICSDVHDNFEAFDLINQKPIFFLGDIYNNQKLIDLLFGTLIKFYRNQTNKEEVIKKFKDRISEIKKSIIKKEIPEFFKKNEVYMLPGNHEDKRFYQKVISLPNIHNLHNKKIKINNIEIIGHGGFFLPSEKMKIDNFYWFSDTEIANNLKNLNASEECIILMHELPLKDYCGKTRKIIEKIKPKFVVGCHNHKGKEEIQINNIRYINCGALMYDKFKIIDIE